MVYTNLLRRTSSRLLLSAQQQQQQQQQALFFSTQQAIAATTTASSSVSQSAPIHRPGVRTISSAAIHTRSETIRGCNSNNCFEELSTTDLSRGTMAMATRSKHSSTQIKRLFKQNPAKRRIALKQNTVKDEGVIPESTIQAQISDPKFLSNGWNPPAETDGQDFPFQVARTKNKPNGAVGFLPVYSEYRKDGARVTTRIKKVSGDRSLFLNELRAALQIPIPKNPREDTIRIRTGGTIEIKGNRVAEVKTWLAGLGF